MTSGGSALVARPRFSIITSSFNQAQFLEETIRSVHEQGRADVEHIVMDGGSTDGSLEILRAHDALLAYWVSAPDAGQPAAWNAGVRRARGDIIGFLNSDDVYRPGALEEITRLADARADAEWLVGGTSYFGDGGGGLSYPGVAPGSASSVLYFTAYAPQPGHFLRRALIERVGSFDESLQFSFDLDYFVRCALAGARAAATERVVAGFRFHAGSKTVARAALHALDTLAVEARHWPEVERREGRAARSARDVYHGRFALGEVRLANAAGRRAEAWRLLAAAVRRYPRVVGTRAFGGTVQRMLGLRSPRATTHGAR